MYKAVTLAGGIRESLLTCSSYYNNNKMFATPTVKLFLKEYGWTHVHVFPLLFTKVNEFRDFLFAFPNDKDLPRRVLL